MICSNYIFTNLADGVAIIINDPASCNVDKARIGHEMIADRIQDKELD